jgi:hypothetical protein
MTVHEKINIIYNTTQVFTFDFCLKHKYLHLLIYYLSGYFRRGVNFAIFSQTVRVGSNFAKIGKSKIKNVIVVYGNFSVISRREQVNFQ